MSTSTSLSILITGATTGIGRHAALYLAARGHHVIASGRKLDLLAELVAEGAKAGHRIDSVSLDVTDSASIAEAVKQVDRITSGRGLDALINNAGYGHPGPMSEVSDASHVPPSMPPAYRIGLSPSPSCHAPPQ